MIVTYPVRIEKSEGTYLVKGIAPFDNVLTYGTTLTEAIENAREALTGVLGSMLDHGMRIPDPIHPVEKTEGIHWIEPDPKVAIPILIRKARLEAGLTLDELAEKVGVTYQQVQKWERAGTNPTLTSLEKIFRALGKKIDLSVIKREDTKRSFENLKTIGGFTFRRTKGKGIQGGRVMESGEMTQEFMVPPNENFACIVFTEFQIPNRRFPSDFLSSPVSIGRNCWISKRPPFTIDQEWKRWMGEIFSNRIENGIGSIVLTAFAEDPSETSEVLLKRIQFVLWGFAIVISIPLFMSADTVHGHIQENTSVQSGISIGFRLTHFYPTPQLLPRSGRGFLPNEITQNELHQAIQFATYMEKIEQTIEQERSKLGIPINQSFTSLFVRPKGGFLALQSGMTSRFMPERLHQFARAIESFIPARVQGRNDFANYLKDLLVLDANNEKTLLQIYDLRSAQEHIRPFDRRALPGETDPDSVAWQRTRQVEGFAREMFKRFFSGTDYLSHFRDESALESFWSSGDVIRAWGSPFDLQGIL